MKEFILIFSIFTAIDITGQIAIGKPSLSPTSNNISLEFYDNSDNVKGIVLPWTSTVADTPVAYNLSNGAGYRGMQGTIADGTLIFDISDFKIKYRKDNSWFNLTGDPTFPLTVKNASNNDVVLNSFNIVDSSMQDNLSELDVAKVAIGTAANTDATPGILVLTDTDKAMVLPKVASPHLNIQNPAPGLIVYDTTKRQLAVYNGTIWSFWKP